MQRLFPSIAAAAAALVLTACSKPETTQPKVTSMGERTTVGHMVYTVFDTKWYMQFPQQPTPRIPKNRFFVVRMSAVNGSGGDVILPDLVLEDDSGTTYQALNNGDGVPQWMGALRKISPAEAAQGNVVFDVPPRHYKLRVQDENGDQSAYIDIPLSFSSEAPDAVPIPTTAPKTQ